MKFNVSKYYPRNLKYMMYIVVQNKLDKFLTCEKCDYLKIVTFFTSGKMMKLFQDIYDV